MLSAFTFSRRAWQQALVGALLVVAGTPFAATAQRVLWSDATGPLPAASRATTQALSQYRAVSVQLPALRAALAGAPSEARLRNSTTVISLPLPNGTSERYRMAQVPVMDPRLAARYPMIKTYVGQSLDDATASVRLDVSPAGFHAMIQGASRTVFIDPAADGNTVQHLVFNRSSMSQGTQSWACVATGSAPVLPAPTAGRLPNGATLRTYRLAMACTGEYAIAKGGTKASTLAAIVASVNRVSGVYEKELAIRLVLIPRTDTLIFLDPATDRYSNLSNSATLSRNQVVVDSLIGTANYDIGHIFNTADGGIAGLGVVCRAGQKASGSTGLPNPTGDAFDIDYVAHEMGHQFGGDHTFNGSTGSCAGNNRSATSAYEPGSGTTIMAYAGICPPQNTQPNSDPYFHSRSYDQIIAYVNGTGNCSVNTATGNNAPVVNAGANYRIPIGTPFTLTGSATDAENDALTYSWEQFNLGPAGTPTAPVGDAPIFRVFAPVNSPVRTFPRLSDLLANTSTIGEILPSYSRRLIFRLVGRDNRATGGGVDYDSMNVVVSGAAGPFLVTVPTVATASWQAGAPQQVIWDVANTTAAPISAANVDILLSTDGGLTFPTVLLANTPNDGFENVMVPTTVATTTTARIKVQASGNIFFDLSNQNFTIRNSGAPTFFLSPTTTQASSFCVGSSLTVPVAIGSLQGFTGTVALSATNLPAGVAVSFNNDNSPVGNTVQATITSTSATPAGFYTIAFTGTSGTESQAQQFSFRVLPIATEAAVPVSPAAGSRVGPRPRFTWNAVPDAVAYELQVATDANFTTVLLTQGGITTTSDTPPAINLTTGTTYYWRVRGVNTCGAAPYSPATAFEIGALLCSTTAATQVPVTISAATANTVRSVINVQNGERVGDIRIRNLAITHPNVGELTISLTNPAGRTVVLLANACPGTANINLNLSDAATSALTCPLTGSPTYRPANSLAPLLNDPATGAWTLTVTDNTPGNGGTITGWSLELCTVGEVPAVPTALTALLNGVTNNVANVNLVWLDNATNETGYQIERTGANNRTFQPVATVSANTTFTTDQISGANGVYCYRIRAINATGVSAYSNESCVTVAVLGNKDAALMRGVQVYPNPSNGLFQVSIDNAQRGTITLRVTDALGRTVERAALNKVGAPLQHSLDLSKLSTGVYQLHLEMPEGTTVVRLMKQ
ncbi:reprolysin-like metallopeptidase [Hymenobacter volaticus]|uniref:M12 family metallo-peptidase n=1 Tax=Hymenobacter volaticus TaxID=2932254 RepID=A0ABY4G8B6_9BACT|nr:zinc-dependent metalloprotease family protein [Hymenobacter volaticus]UOQ67154.1 M12 family metallo-peptidase [Hymenobacter volaticus]